MVSIQKCDRLMPDAAQMYRYSSYNTILNMCICMYVCKANLYRNIASIDY